MMILGLDLDGCVMDYTYGFRRHVAKAKGVEHNTLPEPGGWDFPDWPIRDRDEFEELHTQAVARGMFLHSPAIAGAPEALKKLSDAGVFIRIITSRFIGKGNHAAVGADTFRWLEVNDIPYDEICFVKNKRDVYADCYIDDSPKNLDSLWGAVAFYQTVIAFDAPYNRDAKCHYRFSDWELLSEEVLKLYGSAL